MLTIVESSSASSTTIAEHIKLTRRQNLTSHHQPRPITADDPPLEPTRFCKSTISSFCLFPTSSSSSNETTQTKKKPSGFPQTSSLRGLGCAATAKASRQVSVPAVIRSSAVWESKKVKKKGKKNKIGCNSNGGTRKTVNEVDGGGCVAIPDVWCGPGVGFSTDAVVGGSIEPVGSGAPRRNAQGRRKIDGERISGCHRQSSSMFPRRLINPEPLAFLDSDSMFSTARPEPPLHPVRNRRRIRYPSPDGLPEIMMFQNGYLMGERLESHDFFNDWRLDVDNMTYEQLLELGDRIGHVSTGLKDDEINRCLRRTKPVDTRISRLTALADMKCSVCQEEYEEEEEAGKLNCGHSFHMECIKQWLSRKNACPVCKTPAVAKL